MIAAILLAGCSGASPSSPAPDTSVDAGSRGQTSVDAGMGGSASDAAAHHDSGHETGDAASDRAAADAGAMMDGADAGEDAMAKSSNDAAIDGGTDGTCSVDGVSGQCMTVTACAALTDHTSTAGYCPGPASIECCTDTPSTADNPPTPAGYVLMQQSQVTPAMTTWAVAILNDPTTYAMFSTTTMVFGTLTVLARVEWHSPDFQNSVVHRGVTLYVPS
jgi:hypothetical protein